MILGIGQRVYVKYLASRNKYPAKTCVTGTITDGPVEPGTYRARDLGGHIFTLNQRAWEVTLDDGDYGLYVEKLLVPIDDSGETEPEHSEVEETA